jgi:hypothetical protein
VQRLGTLDGTNLSDDPGPGEAERVPLVGSYCTYLVIRFQGGPCWYPALDGTYLSVTRIWVQPTRLSILDGTYLSVTRVWVQPTRLSIQDGTYLSGRLGKGATRLGILDGTYLSGDPGRGTTSLGTSMKLTCLVTQVEVQLGWVSP